jgi:alpha-tubulin suppressor-like RCC1 family protein
MHRPSTTSPCRPVRWPLALLSGALLAACGGSPAEPPLPGALRFSLLSAGYVHTCALTAAGTAYCWGDNSAGTLGDGSRTSSLVPRVVAAGIPFVEMNAGAGHTCALARDGTAWCWGQNDEGQLGDGTFTVRDRPTALAGNLRFIDLSAGHAHSCGLVADGTVWCWGDNIRGQLGDGTAGGKSALPVRVQSERRFIRVIAGYYQTCAIDTDFRALCWGLNDAGQIGDGSTDDRSVPTPVAGDHRFQELDAGDRFVCALETGAVWCWGANRQGELGTGGGSETPRRVATPSAFHIAASMGTSTIAALQPFACAVIGNGVGCWGGTVRALRDGGAAFAVLPGSPPPRALAVGAAHVCILDAVGYAFCGGGNFAGQLGDGTRTDRASLTAVQKP